MSALGKRLSALEEIAEAARRSSLRELLMSLPEARDLTPGETDEAVAMALRSLERHEAWRRAGIPEREIIRRLAAELGASPEQIEAELRGDGSA